MMLINEGIIIEYHNLPIPSCKSIAMKKKNFRMVDNFRFVIEFVGL